MPYNSNHHDRRSIRLKGYDYTSPGAYFLTLCTHQRQCLFGHIVDGVMHLNDWGQIVERDWLAIPNHYPHVALDEFVVMPNHIHGIVIIGDNDRDGNGRNGDGRNGDGRDGDDRDGDGRRGEAFAPESIEECQKSLPQMLRPQGPIGQDQKSLPQMVHPQGSPGFSGDFMNLDANPFLGTGEAFAPESDGKDQRLLPQMLRPYRSPESSSPRPNGTQPGSIGAIVQTFKSQTTRKINRITQAQGRTLWQRNYYEHIVRNEEALQKMRTYIQMNPRSWASDQLYATP
jgi:putative transposase